MSPRLVWCSAGGKEGSEGHVNVLVLCVDILTVSEQQAVPEVDQWMSYDNTDSSA